MYLYIIGFQTTKHLIVRTFSTDLDDIEILTAYYKDFLCMNDVYIERLTIDETALLSYNNLLSATLQEYEFKQNIKGYWLFKLANTEITVKSIVEHTNKIIAHLKQEDIIRTEFSKFSRDVSAIVKKSVETDEFKQNNTEEVSVIAAQELDSFYKIPSCKRESLYFRAPSGIISNNNFMYEEVTLLDDEIQCIQKQTKDGFGNIIVFENLLTGFISYKIDNDGWTETLRNSKLVDVFPEVIVYASHLYRKLPHVEMLIDAYFKFQRASAPEHNTEDIFLKLESIVGIDNLKREYVEGSAFGISQEITMTKETKKERQLMDKYMSLLMGSSNAEHNSELLLDTIDYFMENYITKEPAGYITLVGLTTVIKKWLTEYLNSTAFGRFSHSLASSTIDSISNQVSKIFAKHNISVDDNIVYGFIFNEHIINLAGPLTGISTNEPILRSMYFEYTVLLPSQEVRLPAELTENLYTEIIKKFFNDAVEDKADSTVPSRELWGAFTRYLQLINGGNIMQRLGQTDFTPLCKSLGFEVKRSAAGMMWKRIALKPMFSNHCDNAAGSTPITTYMSASTVSVDAELTSRANVLLSALGENTNFREVKYEPVHWRQLQCFGTRTVTEI